MRTKIVRIIWAYFTLNNITLQRVMSQTIMWIIQEVRISEVQIIRAILHTCNWAWSPVSPWIKSWNLGFIIALNRDSVFPVRTNTKALHLQFFRNFVKFEFTWVKSKRSEAGKKKQKGNPLFNISSPFRESNGRSCFPLWDLRP